MVSTFSQAQKYLFSHIPKSDIKMFPGEAGLARMKDLAKEIGDPQEKYKAIHLAGTSGKGSTASIISSLLVGQGFKVGLQLSPHILDIRERVQIDDDLISNQKFIDYLNEIIPSVEKVSKGKYGEVSYFEILVALAYFSFWKEKVDYAVIETGMGGLYDGTNVIQNPEKLSVITRIGHDHMSVLGKTLPLIAAQKAGIIQEKNTVITIDQPKKVLDVLRTRANEQSATFVQINKGDYTVHSVTEKGTIFVDKKRNENVELGLIGTHQAENAMTALEVISIAAERDGWNINEDQKADSLRKMRIPARIDIRKYKGATLVIDGAHNVQKMKAFLAALEQLYPEEKLTFLVAFKKGKDIKKMIKLIQRQAKQILVTDFMVDTQDMINFSMSPDRIAELNTSIPIISIQNSKKAIDYALTLDKRIIITGSLYFASEIYQELSL